MLYHAYVCIHTCIFDIDSHAMPYVPLLESHLFDPVWAILVPGTVFVVFWKIAPNPLPLSDV